MLKELFIMINPFYNAYREKLDHKLTSELNKEAIQMMGFDCLYLKREYVNEDKLLGEDREKQFSKGKPIEMWCENTKGFEGGNEMKSLFGNMWEQSGTFVVNKERFAEEFPDIKIPNAGDLLFMPYANVLLEIKYVETESDFFPQSSTVYYKLNVELFKYSHEEISNDTSENLDKILTDQFLGKLENVIIDDPEHDIGSYGDNDEPKKDYSNRFKFKESDKFKPKH